MTCSPAIAQNIIVQQFTGSIKHIWSKHSLLYIKQANYHLYEFYQGNYKFNDFVLLNNMNVH